MTFSSDPTNLRYLGGRIFYQGVSDTNTFEISDLTFYDDTTVATSYPASNAVDDDTSTYWKSNSETNPNIYVDLGSNKNSEKIAGELKKKIYLFALIPYIKNHE